MIPAFENTGLDHSTGHLRKGQPLNNTEKIIEFIVSANWDDFPENVRHQSRRTLLDALGAMIAGTRTPVGELMADIVTRQYANGPSTLLGTGVKVSTVGAALANGFAGNALDIDDGYRLVKGHPGACILPVALAAAESIPRCSGRDFLTAMVVGYEVAIRAGMIRHAIYDVYHSSGSWGAIGGAGVAGRLMGLGPEKLYHALGAAEYHAPIAPMMKLIECPGMGKDSIGWGAMVGMLSAEMAGTGFTGPRSIFDDTPNQTWIDTLGKQYEFMNLYFKPYAACRWAQAGVDGVLKLIARHDLKPESIREIRVYTFAEAAALSRSHPASTEDAQYNFSFPIAAAVLDGEVGPAQVLPPRIFDKDLLLMMDKVTPVVREKFQMAFPAKALSEVRIEDNCGRLYHSGVMSARWEPGSGLPTDTELEKKFLWLVAPVLGDERAEELVNIIRHFDEETDICVLIEACKKFNTLQFP